MRKTKGFLVVLTLVLWVGSAFAATEMDMDREMLDAMSGMSSKEIQNMTEADYLALLDRFKERPPLSAGTTALYMMLSFCNYQLGHYQPAVNMLENVVTTSPNDAGAWGLLAVSYKAIKDQKRAAQATAMFVRVLKQNSENLEDSRKAWLIGKLLE